MRLRASYTGIPSITEIGAREVDILEHAEPFRDLAERPHAVDALVVDDDDLARLHVAHELGADDLERAGLARQHPALADPSEDQRPHAERIAHAHQRRARQRHQGVGADDLLERVDQPVHDRRVKADRDEVDEHFAVRRGLEQAAAPDKRAAEDMGVGEVAVMRDGKAAELEIGVQRLHIAQDRVAGGGVAIVADGVQALRKPMTLASPKLSPTSPMPRCEWNRAPS